MSVENPTEQEMSIWDHVDELRTRLLIALGALIVTTGASFAFAQNLMVILARPIGGLQELQSIQITENVGVFMRVSLLSGFILALPIMLYEILAFIMPGLYPNERRWLYISIPTATLLFIGGVIFSYAFMLPTAVPFLVSFGGIPSRPTPSNYLGFVTNLLFWIGVAFETPLVVFILAKFKVVTPGMLLKQWRFAVVIIAVLAAMITPTVDPVNMGLLMAPLFAIYLLSILFAKLAVR